MSLSERLQEIRKRIASALKRSPHGPRPVQLVGVSKSQSINLVRSAADLGLVHMGENYAQELLSKAPLCMDKAIRWHFIGKLQSNKIKHILPYVHSIDTVDSVELARKIARMNEQSEVPRPTIPVMLQVNVGSERQKSGLPPGVIEDLFPEFLAVEGMAITGLMAIPPVHKEVEKMRPYYQAMKALFDRLKEKFPEAKQLEHLSMGMSQDFEVAVEEGSTCIRIGEALFGPRPEKK